MKVIALLMLLSLIAEELAMPCSRLAQPENCINHPRIRVTKTSSHYRLSLCSNNPDCLPSRNQDSEWFECKDLCDVCRSLPGTPSRNEHAECMSIVYTFSSTFETLQAVLTIKHVKHKWMHISTATVKVLYLQLQLSTVDQQPQSLL